MTCECDFDLSGDPGRYFRSNHKTLCPVHDMCVICDEAKAVIIVDGDKCCKECALEPIVVCPNCGREGDFILKSSHHVEKHGLDFGPYEEWDDEWLVCHQCNKPTDQQEINRVQKERIERIKGQLQEMGL